MSDVNTSASPKELTRTFGVLLIGFIFSVVLYGLTFFQTYIYFTRFPSDNLATKWTVGLLWATDTASTTLISHTIYYYLITNFLTVFEDLPTTKTFLGAEGLCTFLILIVQAFYAYRVWTVSGRQIAVPAVILALAAGACALNFTGLAHIARQSLFAQIVTSQVRLFRGIGTALATVNNFVIVGVLLYHMQPERNPGMARPTDKFEQLVVYIFNRGVAFAIVQTLSFIVFLALSQSQGWKLLSWICAKIYVNSLLAMLNYRNTHRGRGINEEDSLNQHASNRSGSISGPSGPRETARSVQFTVHPDLKTHDPTNIIELDMVPSRIEGYDDDVSKR